MNYLSCCQSTWYLSILPSRLNTRPGDGMVEDAPRDARTGGEGGKANDLDSVFRIYHCRGPPPPVDRPISVWALHGDIVQYGYQLFLVRP